MIGAGALLAAIGLIATGAPVTSAKPSGHRPRCTLIDGVMRLETGYWQPAVSRKGDRIIASYARGEIDCGGTAPTVTNVDRIELDTAEFDLDLSGGPLAPGRTPEADGSSEIEVTIGVGLLSSGPLSLALSGADDHVTLGRLSRGRIGVNLNADEATGDPDIEFVPTEDMGLKYLGVEINGGRGDDELGASGGDGFKGAYPADLLELRGGPGDDQLVGSNMTDFLIAGGGRDSIKGGRGNDIVGTRDSERDLVACGKGKDIIALDPRDRTRGCERKYRPGDRRGTPAAPPPRP